MPNRDPVAHAGSARVWAVVLNWNGASKTARCVQSLRASSYPSLHVVVVDNGSTDGSAARLRAALPQLHVIETGVNGGFSAGSNAGIQLARDATAAYTWLVNNDAEVEPDALSALVQIADESPDVGAVGSVVVSPANPRDVEVWGGGWIDHRVGRAGRYTSCPASGAIDYLVGASLLLRIDALDPRHPLDEAFFLYWEDADLCYRLRADGWRLAIAGRSIVRHRGHGSLQPSSPQFDFHYHQSAAYFFRRHHTSFPAAPIVIGAAARFGMRVARGRWRQALAVWQGTAAGLRTPMRASISAVPVESVPICAPRRPQE